MLNIKHLTVSVAGKPLLHDLNLTLKPGQIHALMGPNGAGKSSLALALMGHPQYSLAPGSSLKLNHHELLSLSPSKRAQAGLFLAFQHPIGIEGVSLQNLLKSAYEVIHCTHCYSHNHCPRLSVTEFRELLLSEAKTLNISSEFLSRSLSSGFSGGEQKRLEILQLLILKPAYALLDEPDSGLDIDSLKTVASGIHRAAQQNHTGILLITHNPRLLKYLTLDAVSVLIHGKIVQSGGPDLVLELEKTGFNPLI